VISRLWLVDGTETVRQRAFKQAECGGFIPPCESIANSLIAGKSFHCSGVVVAKGSGAHNNKKSANTRRNLAVDCGKAVDLLEANPRTSFVYATGSEESVTGATTV